MSLCDFFSFSPTLQALCQGGTATGQVLQKAAKDSGSAKSGSSGPTQGSGPSPCILLIPNPVKGIPLIGDLISSAGICLFTKTEARALIGGLALAAGSVTTLIGTSILIVSAIGHTKAGQAAAQAGGGLAEGVGAGLALVPGAEVAGAAIAAGGSHIKRRQGAAGKTAQRIKTGRQQQVRQAATETRTQERHVSTQRRIQERHTSAEQRRSNAETRAQERHDEALYKSVSGRKNPGRKGATLKETSGQRSARMANPTGTGRHRKPVTREEVGF
jgi:hypothetical protein